MARARTAPDPVRLEVFHHLLAAVCEESGALLGRSAISPNIRERRDFSCALFDGDGRLLAQAAHIPVHLGSAADSVAAVRDALALEPGDVAILNDPYRGGTHLPDVTMVRPVFCGRRARAPAFFVVNRAHHADIGGAVAGSMAVAADLYAEGLVIPPVKLRSRGEESRAVLDLLSANVRGAAERRIDLQAQEASLTLAERRLRALVDEHSLPTVRAYASHLMDYSAKIARGVVRGIPRGDYRAVDAMEDDGLGGGPFELKLCLRVRPGRLTFDYRGSAAQAEGGINANKSVVAAASLYLLRCLCPARLPTNDGLFRVLRIVTERGSILDPEPPAPVAGGNVETSQRLCDLGLRALAEALPGKIPAGAAGTMTNFTLGGSRPVAFTMYETLPGGAGGGPAGQGASAIQTHMTNTRNTSIEETELRYPLRIRELTVRRGSGGAGAHRGGDGLIKEVELLAAATMSLFSERSVAGPAGVAGGAAGRPGKAYKVAGGRRTRLPAKGSQRVAAGDRVRIETPGGGGFGRR